MKQLAVGIDIGGTNSVYGLVDRDGNMYGEGVVPTKKFPDFDQYLEELYIGIQSLMKNIHVSAAQAMVILDVPEGERQKYLDLLEKQ